MNKISTIDEKNSNNNRIEEIDLLAKEIVKLRNKPLLVLYYPDGYPDNYAEICDDDIEDVNNIFRKFSGYGNEKKIEQLDVLLHTDGGVPDSAYQLAQIIRNFSNNVNFLIPIKAASAGTLMCSCANEILLGDYGVLSSIDISFDEGETELINIHYFMKFAVDCRKMTEKMFEENECENAETRVESDLLTAMVEDIGVALKIGGYYREQNLTGVYARTLMLDYMFAADNNKENITDKIIEEILYKNPAHNFRMDYNMCEKLKLPVKRMNDDEFEKTKNLILRLQDLTIANIICKESPMEGECICKKYKLPYFYLYDIDENTNKLSSVDVQDFIYKLRKHKQEFRRHVPFNPEE